MRKFGFILLLAVIIQQLPSEIVYGMSPLFALGGGSLGIKEGLPVADDLSISVSPNPFNPCVRIETGLRGQVRLDVYDISGRLILSQKAVAPHGKTTFVWDSRDVTGHAVASGLYFAHVANSGKSLTTRMMLMR